MARKLPKGWGYGTISAATKKARNARLAKGKGHGKAGGKVIAKMGTRKGFKGAVKGKRVNDAFAELLAQIKAELPKKSTRKFKSAAISQKLADKRETEYLATQAEFDIARSAAHRAQSLLEEMVLAAGFVEDSTPDCRLAYLALAKKVLALTEKRLITERVAVENYDGAYKRMWGDEHGEFYTGRNKPLKRDEQMVAKFCK